MTAFPRCPKCGHQRQAADPGHPGECPRCGVIYAKAHRSADTAPPLPQSATRAAPPPPTDRWRPLRVLFLLLVLLFVAVGGWLNRERTTSWERTLVVAVHPLNGDGSRAAEEYIGDWHRERFVGLEEFFQREARRYGVTLGDPVQVVAGQRVDQPPPPLPRERGVLEVMWWSLRTRWWSWGIAREGPPAHIRAYLSYFDPATHPTLPHSTGLEKGLVALVNLFAHEGMERQNQVVLTHELFHTLGASDKYDPATNLPLYPIGYGDPGLSPRFPQPAAEVMGGRLMLEEGVAVQPAGLEQVVVGPATALEIGWIQP